MLGSPCWTSGTVVSIHVPPVLTHTWVIVLCVPFSQFILRTFVGKVNSLTMKWDNPERENICPALGLAKQQPHIRHGFLSWAFCPPGFSYGIFAGFPPFLPSCRKHFVLLDMVGLVVGDYHLTSGLSEVFTACGTLPA